MDLFTKSLNDGGLLLLCGLIIDDNEVLLVSFREVSIILSSLTIRSSISGQPNIIGAGGGGNKKLFP